MGVTSLMDLISTPAAWRARIADSRPLPGPLTRMSSGRRPLSLATVAAAVAACWAAKGVPLREPLKPRVPALDHVTTWPSRSVMVTCVLLKDACTWAIPWITWRFSFLLFFGLGMVAGLSLMVSSRLGGGGGGGLFGRAEGGAARPFARARVRVGARAAQGGVPAVPHAAVRADLHQALDVQRDLLAQVALHSALP